MNIDELYTVKHHEKGAEMQVKDENGKPLKMWLTVVGIDSKTWRNSFNESRKEIIQNTENADAELYASCTLDWRGFKSGGEKLEFSKESVKQLYINAPYIMGQVDRFIADRGNFTKS